MSFLNSNSSLTQNANTNSVTVTAMLAERMANSSVDEEHISEANRMNVWQTLEFLADVKLRKRYLYQGYNDPESTLRNLTPSWRRDNFAGTNIRQLNDADEFNTVNSSGEDAGSREAETHSSLKTRTRGERGFGVNCKDAQRTESHKQDKTRQPRQLKQIRQSSAEAIPMLDADLVKCRFNFPRISARLERLMGSNVVRLTDRKYMRELRERIEQDYLIQMQKRITAREDKEVERERILIIEGKSDIIPKELADDPIFMVNKKANIEIQKQRAKLKTNRERNSERLKMQGAKWERERLQHEEEERSRLEVQRQRQREQKALEEKYREEDGERCMDLLRIHNEQWRPCEQKLKEFLETERTAMKERSKKKSVPYTSDPKDIQNVVRARRELRKAAKRMRQEMAAKEEQERERAAKEAIAKIPKPKCIQRIETQPPSTISEDNKQEQSREYLLQNEEADRLRKRYLDENSDVSSESELVEIGSSISESKRKHAAKLEEEMENDVQRGLLISKGQYAHLRHEEDKVKELRQASNIRDLYRLAEEIIIGDRIVEPIVEEEAEEEQEEDDEPQDDSDELDEE